VSHAFKRGVLIKAYIPLGEAHALFVATHLSDRKRPIQVHTCNANDTHVSMSDIRVGHKKTPAKRGRESPSRDRHKKPGSPRPGRINLLI
jgi:hypothetical protein